MRKPFNPKLGKNAFSDGCPCCGEVCTEYQPEDKENFASWQFACGCEVVLENGTTPYAYSDCPYAMQSYMDEISVEEAAKL